MNMMLKMVLGTCLLGFVNLAGMTKDEAKKASGGKSNVLSVPDVTQRRRASSGSESSERFLRTMGSLKGSCNDVLRLHTDAIINYQKVLEGADEKLLKFSTLDHKESAKVVAFKESFFRELDALKKDTLVEVVRALHESVFKAGLVERLVVPDKNKLLMVDPVTGKMMLSSVSRVILWCDEFFIIDELRAIASSLETAGLIEGDGKESHESQIKERLEYGNFVDSLDKSVKHSEFSGEVNELLAELSDSLADKEVDKAQVAKELRSAADGLATKYLKPVL